MNAIRIGKILSLAVCLVAIVAGCERPVGSDANPPLPLAPPPLSDLTHNASPQVVKNPEHGDPIRNPVEPSSDPVERLKALKEQLPSGTPGAKSIGLGNSKPSSAVERLTTGDLPTLPPGSSIGDLGKELGLAAEKGEAAAESQLNPNFYVRYHYATETDRDDVEVRNSALLYTDLGPIDLAERPAQTDPIASRPLYADTDLIRYQGTLSAPQVAALTKLLHDIAFLKLNATYGGPAPGGRSDEETFEIKLDGQQKKVIYHHHPTAEPMPEELVKLRTELFRLVHQKFRLKHEQEIPR